MEPEMISLCKLHGEKLDVMQTSIDKLVESINGNGKPGLKQMVDRHDVTIGSFVKAFWIIVAGALTVCGGAIAMNIIGKQ
jgi:hypothetical protein